ncbi:MAG: hypothetical protein Q7W45_13400 [Bacteroidota bacterium]|nr:hypothetical protein [Bacteroidota bacterium]MDP3144483.1 hypothetical protein [Bacteroidota bacterium]MDP3555839.1 hypothetical protein [Bacteroidota bacterium]
MFTFFRDKSHILFAFLFIVSISHFFVGVSQQKIEVPNRTELFNPQLLSINSIDKALAYTDSIYNLSHSKSFDTLAYVKIASTFIKERFYHSLSSYNFSENWIAYGFSKIFWSHFSAIVNPDHILKYPEGLCSQQNIIFSEVLRKKGITSRPVGLGPKKGPGHYLTEVFYNNDWHIYDVDLEPNWEITELNHPSLKYLLSNKEILYKIYENKLTPSHLDFIIKDVKYGKPNTFPATNMLWFHKITLGLSYIFPLLFLILFIRALMKQKKHKIKKNYNLNQSEVLT